MKKLSYLISAFAFVFAATVAIASSGTAIDQTDGYYIDGQSCTNDDLDHSWTCAVGASSTTCTILSNPAYEGPNDCGDSSKLLKRVN